MTVTIDDHQVHALQARFRELDALACRAEAIRAAIPEGGLHWRGPARWAYEHALGRLDAAVAQASSHLRQAAQLSGWAVPRE